MIQQEYIIKRKLNILELAETLGNVSEAARRSGASRKHICDIKRTLIEEGVEGLREKTKRVARKAIRTQAATRKSTISWGVFLARTNWLSRVKLLG